MRVRLIVLALSIMTYTSVSAQLLYNSSTQVGTRFNPGYNLLSKPKIAFDDISIANSLLQGIDSIAVGKVNIGIRRVTNAPQTDVNVYYTPWDDTSTQQNTAIKIPPVLLGRVTLPPNGASSTTTIVSVGDGSSTLFKMKTDTNRLYPGFHTFFIGISLSNNDPANAIWMTSGPEINKNYIVMYNADSTVQRFSARFDNFAATFYIQVLGVSPTTLPIVLSQFKGELKETGANDVSWTTESETNNKGFELQRSLDGVTFDSIAFVATAAIKGTSMTKINYYYSVSKPLPGNNFYRLRQQDLDGHFTFSPVILVKNGQLQPLQISHVFPNPAKSVLHVSMTSTFTGNVHVSMHDLAGSVVMDRIEKIMAGPNNVIVNVSGLLSGRYSVKVTPPKVEYSVIASFIKQ